MVGTPCHAVVSQGPADIASSSALSPLCCAQSSVTQPRLVTSTIISLADGPCMVDPQCHELRASTKVGLGFGSSVAVLKEPAWIQHIRKVSTLFFKCNTMEASDCQKPGKPPSMARNHHKVINTHGTEQILPLGQSQHGKNCWKEPALRCGSFLTMEGRQREGFVPGLVCAVSGAPRASSPKWYKEYAQATNYKNLLQF